MRAEGVIVPGRVTVGHLGVVGTASKGPIRQPVLLGSYAEARRRFGEYDPWIDGKSNELTLVRTLELAYAHGATNVRAVRVASASATKAACTLNSGSGECVRLTAKTEGTWANDLMVNVWKAEEHAYIEEEHLGDEGRPIKLSRTPVVKSARNRIQLFTAADGLTHPLQILYDDDANAPAASQVKVNRADGTLAFGDTVAAADKVTAWYLVDKSMAVKVTFALGQDREVYTVVDGNDLVNDVTELSAWVDAEAADHPTELLSKSAARDAFAVFYGGLNGAAKANYKDGLAELLDEEAHILVAAGQDDSFGAELDAHCQVASSDTVKRERIAVVGSKLNAAVDELCSHNFASDRVIFVAPGIKTTDAPSSQVVTLPGAYAAAAVAGLLARYSAHVSLTNKTLQVGGLERHFTSAELTQLVQSRLLALEARQGFRVVKGITTSTNAVWHQITTRRIVDYARLGVRSACTPYSGLINNVRVRSVLRASVNSFLAEMVDDEMLISYELDVSATREEELKGLARVTMVLRPVFSIDFIKITMFLE